MDDLSAARACPVFEGLSAVELQDVSGLTSQLDLREGTSIFRDGDEADGMYVVASGAVRIVQGEGPSARDLAVLGESVAFVEMALLLEGTRNASAIAATNCRLLRIDRDGFMELLEAQERVACRVLLNLARMVSRRLVAIERSTAD